MTQPILSCSADRVDPSVEKRSYTTADDALSLADGPCPPLRRRVFGVGDTLRPHVARRVADALTDLPFVVDASFDQRCENLRVGLVGEGEAAVAVEAFLTERGIHIVRPWRPKTDDSRSPLGRRALSAMVLVALGSVAGAMHRFGESLSWQVRDFALNLEVLFALALVFWLGARPLAEVLAGLAKGRLIASAPGLMLGAFLVGWSVVIFFSGGEPFFEAGMIATGTSIALEWWLSRLRTRARGGLRAWSPLPAEDARLLQPGGLYRVASSALAPGDLVVTQSGERIPADGIARSGSAFVAEAAVRHSPEVRQVQAGGNVWSGDRVQVGTLVTEVSHGVLGSPRLRISDHLRVSEEDAARPDRSLSGHAVVAVVGACLAALGLFIWGAETPLIGEGRPPWARAMALLLVGVPVAFAAARALPWIACASRLSEGGAFLKRWGQVGRLASARSLLIEPAGTLTVGRPEVTGWIGAPDLGVDPVLALVQSLCVREESPLTDALTRLCREADLPAGLAAPLNARKVLAGRGIRAEDPAGDEVTLGTSAMLREAGIELSGGGLPVQGMGVQGDPGQACDTGGVLYLTQAGRVLARFHLLDPVRSEAREVLEALKEAGLECGVQDDGWGDLGRATAETLDLSLTTAPGAIGTDLVLADASKQGFTERPSAPKDPATLTLSFGAGMASDVSKADITFAGESLWHVPHAIQLARRASARRKVMLRACVGTTLLGWVVAASGVMPLALAACVGSAVSAALASLSVRGGSSP